MLFVFVTVVSKFFNFAKLSEHRIGILAASYVLLIVRFSFCVFGADFVCIKAVPEFVDRWCGQLHARTKEISKFLVVFLKEKYLSTVHLRQS
jgi:hypothetical protein